MISMDLLLKVDLLMKGHLFNLIGTTAEQAGLTKQDGFLNGEKIKQYVGPLLSNTCRYRII